jgi:hypothetical protein
MQKASHVFLIPVRLLILVVEMVSSLDNDGSSSKVSDRESALSHVGEETRNGAVEHGLPNVLTIRRDALRNKASGMSVLGPPDGHVEHRLTLRRE